MNSIDAVATKAVTAAAITIAGGVESISIVLLVGVIGGIIGWLKKLNIETLKDNKIGVVLDFPFAIAVPAALTAIVFFAGTHGVNIHAYDLGEPIWLFLGFLIGLYGDTVIKTIGETFPKVMGTLLDKLRR